MEPGIIDDQLTQHLMQDQSPVLEARKVLNHTCVDRQKRLSPGITEGVWRPFKMLQLHLGHATGNLDHPNERDQIAQVRFQFFFDKQCYRLVKGLFPVIALNLDTICPDILMNRWIIISVEQIFFWREYHKDNANNLLQEASIRDRTCWSKRWVDSWYPETSWTWHRIVSWSLTVAVQV